MLFQTLRPLARAGLLRALTVTSQRRLQSKSSVPPKMLRLQKKFQEKNNVPVHLKGGAADKMLYITTVGLAGVGFLYMLVFLAGYLID